MLSGRKWSGSGARQTDTFVMSFRDSRSPELRVVCAVGPVKSVQLPVLQSSLHPAVLAPTLIFAFFAGCA